ncbi:MAG TPA: DMT family transporter [Casimicrobiaceae bacterium]|jgi:drug/metabolite transporter (DMT)-like permease|nr:DMT family transporter [Casimicrobiaceae bacterium]
MAQWRSMIDRSIVSSSQRSLALAALHLAVLLFGFAGLFGKWLPLPPVTIVFGRAAIAAIALALLFPFAGERGEARGRFEWALAASGAVLALHWVAFFQAIQTAGVAVGLLGFASFPLFVLLLEATLRQRRLRFVEWVTAALVTGGLLLVVPEFRWENRIVRGLSWGIVSGFTFALLAVGNRALAPRHSASAIAFWQNACAAACLLPLVAVTAVVPDARAILLLVALGVVCTALAHTLFIRSLRTLSAHTASVVAALEPVYGIALALLLLGEIPPARTLAGAVLIIGAALYASWRSGMAIRSLR